MAYNWAVEPGGASDAGVGETVTASYSNAIAANIRDHTHNPSSGDGGALSGVPQTPLLDARTFVMSDNTGPVTVMSYSVAGNTLGRHGMLRATLSLNLDDLEGGTGTVNSMTFSLIYGTTVIVSMNSHLKRGANTNRSSFLIATVTAAQSDTQKQSGRIQLLNFDTTSFDLPVGPTVINGATGEVGSAAEDSTGALAFAIEMTYANMTGNTSLVVDHFLVEQLS